MSDPGNPRELPAPAMRAPGEPWEQTPEVLPFRASLTLAARALAGISSALHRIADALEEREP